MLAIRLPEKIERRSNASPNKPGVQKHIRSRSILQYLDDLEDIYFAQKELEGDPLGTKQDRSAWKK